MEETEWQERTVRVTWSSSAPTSEESWAAATWQMSARARPASTPRRPSHPGRPPVSTYGSGGYLSGSSLLECLSSALVARLHRISAPASGLSHRDFRIKPTGNQNLLLPVISRVCQVCLLPEGAKAEEIRKKIERLREAQARTLRRELIALMRQGKVGR